MTKETLEYAKSKGFRLVETRNATHGYSSHLKKENVDIFVESYDYCERWHRMSDETIRREVDDFEKLKAEADFLDEYAREIDRRMGYVRNVS